MKTDQQQKSLLSVVVCTFNRAPLLRLCLESLVSQRVVPDTYEVVVVDNNSTDLTKEVAEEFAAANGNFRVVFEPEQGLSHARNRGWHEAKGEYVAYVDDDAKASPQWCERILQAIHDVKPAPVALGGPVFPWFDFTPPAWFDGAFEVRTLGEKERFLDGPGFFGGNMVIRKEALARHGGFSPDFGMKGDQLRMGEERELLSRIYQAEPCFWYDPKMLVEHYTPRQKTKIFYRIYRQWQCGMAAGKIEGQRYGFWKFSLASMTHVLLATRVTIYRWVTEEQRFVTSLVKGMEECAFMSGKFWFFYKNRVSGA
ncbi:glycosyltransferase family 2 protein [Thiovibrio sp. JS02]